MSLPACQQRALDRMEGALRASEPHLASMYAIFGRLNADEPIGTERLTRKRLRLLQQGSAMYAIVLVPVMFAAIIVGALLGGVAQHGRLRRRLLGGRRLAAEQPYHVSGIGQDREGRGAQDDLRHRAAGLHRWAGRPVYHPGREGTGGPPGGPGVRDRGWPAWVVLGTSQGRRSRCQSSSSGTGRPNY